MARRACPAQLAFPFPKPALPWQKPVEVAPQRPLLDRLVDAGLSPNRYLLSTNRCLTAPAEHRTGFPWSLPSRLYTFGVRIAGWDDEPRLAVGVEALLEHPYVGHLRGIGFEVDVNEDVGHASYMHAVDLATNRHWEDLLLTRRHATPESIAAGIGYALQYTDLTVWNARTVMREMGWPEPEDRSAALLRGSGLHPAKVPEGYAPNPRRQDVAGAWMMVHGLEDKWLKRGRHGHAWVTPEGMARRAA
ncbi:hypothetical protein [Lichenibacterium dinghuense]|uniref:hypothetical protein n=1 Tax=Lichenibacterium dinghuense TaxID=2895977 RepID=UPI001F458EAC|nr:hypothetical protein [Lichenibacterium sp. 6Y81]